MMTMMIIIW